MSEPGNRPFALNSVPVTFLSVMALLVVALGWLGWLLLDQDRSLRQQRTRERVDAAAAELEQAFADGIAAERSRLDEIAGVLSSGQSADVPALLDALRGSLTVIHFSAGGTTVAPERDLLYLAISGKP
ncbi:MAG: hypothetical protein IH848_09925, partial [Acidobacteria bacterium]|nr:hypothetical protein [Acidobacteriota bacterium]